MSNSILSLVICTHRRFQLLDIAIQSLCEQNADKNNFEVIVVDNDSQTNSEVVSIIEKAKKKIIIRYLLEKKIGLSFARNTGGKAAISDYIGYMDDDARAPKNYIKKAIELIHSKNCDILGGPYYPYYLNPKPKWFKDEYASGIASNESNYLKKGQYLCGTNMIYTKLLLSELDFFNTTYGMSGKKLAYGEETHLQIRAWRKYPNLKIYYDLNMFMEHFVPFNKMKISDRCKRMFYVGKSQAFLWAEYKDQSKILKKAPLNLLKSVFFLITKGILSLFYRDKKCFPFWHNYAYEHLSKYLASIGQESQRTKALLLKRLRPAYNLPSKKSQ